MPVNKSETPPPKSDPPVAKSAPEKEQKQTAKRSTTEVQPKATSKTPSTKASKVLSDSETLATLGSNIDNQLDASFLSYRITRPFSKGDDAQLCTFVNAGRTWGEIVEGMGHKWSVPELRSRFYQLRYDMGEDDWFTYWDEQPKEFKAEDQERISMQKNAKFSSSEKASGSFKKDNERATESAKEMVETATVPLFARHRTPQEPKRPGRKSPQASDQSIRKAAAKPEEPASTATKASQKPARKPSQNPKQDSQGTVQVSVDNPNEGVWMRFANTDETAPKAGEEWKEIASQTSRKTKGSVQVATGTPDSGAWILPTQSTEANPEAAARPKASTKRVPLVSNDSFRTAPEVSNPGTWNVDAEWPTQGTWDHNGESSGNIVDPVEAPEVDTKVAAPKSKGSIQMDAEDPQQGVWIPPVESKKNAEKNTKKVRGGSKKRSQKSGAGFVTASKTAEMSTEAGKTAPESPKQAANESATTTTKPTFDDGTELDLKEVRSRTMH